MEKEKYLEKIIEFDKQNNKIFKKTHESAIKKGLYPEIFAMPLSMQFELTTACNLRCKHCYNRSDFKKNDEMPIERWIELSEEIINQGGLFQCIISGGEPLLLGNDLFKIMDLFHEDGTAFLLITNGFLLTKYAVEKLKKYRFFWVQVSIDGHDKDVHDSFRGVNGSWQKAVQGALRVADAGLPLTIAHSVTPGNIQDIPKTAKLAYQCGASSFIAGEIFPSGRATQDSGLLMNNDQRSEMLKLLDLLNNAYSGKMQVQRSVSNKIQMERGLCLPNTGAILRPNGDIRLDCVAPFVMANVANSSFKDAWQKYSHLCWHDPRVKKYIDSVDLYTGISKIHHNYNDEDIRL